MIGASNGLAFDLYTTPAMTQVWTAGPFETTAPYNSLAGIVAYDMLLNTSPKTSPAFVAYGKIFPSQTSAKPGAYSWTAVGPGARYGYTPTGNCTTAPPPLQTNLPGSTWTATIPTLCSVTTQPINFGTVAALTTNIDATGFINTQCTNGTPYTIGLNAGTGPTATTTLRQMSFGGNLVSYKLFRDAAHTQNWGNAGGPEVLSATGTGNTISSPVYGRIPGTPTPTPPSGTYTDSVAVTVTY